MPLVGPRFLLPLLALLLSLVLQPAYAATPPVAGAQRWSVATATAVRPEVPAVAFSADSAVAFVAESGGDSASNGNLVARDARTGSRLWVGPGAIDGRPTKVLASTADAVVVASQLSGTRDVVAAFRSSDGAQVWRQEAALPPSVQSYAADVTVDPVQRVVYRAATLVTQGPGGTISQVRGVVSAHDLDTGAPVWSRSPLNSTRYVATALAASPDGRRIFVGGTAYDDADLAGAHRWMSALDARSGATAWVTEDRGPYGTRDGVDAIAVSADGRAVAAASTAQIVVGDSYWSGLSVGVRDAERGSAMWRSERTMFATIDRTPMKITPDGRTLLVGAANSSQGRDAELSVIAYDLTGGAERWFRVFADGRAQEDDVPLEIHVDPAGERAYLVGRGSVPGIYAFSTASGIALSDPTWTGDVGIESSALSPDGEILLVAGPRGANRGVTALHARGAPTAPPSFTARPGPGEAEVTLSWGMPLDDGGQPLRAFRISRRTSAGWEQIAEVGPSVLTHRLTGLPLAQMERYSVAAVSAVGEGARSREGCATPYPWVASLDGLRCA